MTDKSLYIKKVVSNIKKESRTRLVECPSFKGKVFGSNPNVFINFPSKLRAYKNTKVCWGDTK